jgi:Fe-S-cluster containining protein
MELDEILNARAAELGPDYMLKEPPLLIEHDSARLQRRAKNEGFFRKLAKLYEPVPEVTCGACGRVCSSASPDFYFLEFLLAWRYIRYELDDPALESEIVARSVRWAFLSFIKKDIFCPFLFDGRCVIYGARPFNCRVWALEDDAYYERKAARAAAHVAKQQDFFTAHGVKTLKPMKEFILPRCTKSKSTAAARASRKAKSSPSTPKSLSSTATSSAPNSSAPSTSASTSPATSRSSASTRTSSTKHASPSRSNSRTSGRKPC